MSSFYERPILNSPYRAPELHHPLDKNGQPLEGEPNPGRRPSRFIVPVPASRKKNVAAQASLDLETYTENALINEILTKTDGAEFRRLRLPYREPGVMRFGEKGAKQRTTRPQIDLAGHQVGSQSVAELSFSSQSREDWRTVR